MHEPYIRHQNADTESPRAYIDYTRLWHARMTRYRLVGKANPHLVENVGQVEGAGQPHLSKVCQRMSGAGQSYLSFMAYSILLCS